MWGVPATRGVRDDAGQQPVERRIHVVGDGGVRVQKPRGDRRATRQVRQRRQMTEEEVKAVRAYLGGGDSNQM